MHIHGTFSAEVSGRNVLRGDSPAAALPSLGQDQQKIHDFCLHNSKGYDADGGGGGGAAVMVWGFLMVLMLPM